MFASEIKEAEAASFASGPSLNTLVDNMSESDGVSYIYYNLGGAANNINNCGYITPKQKFMGLREPHKYGYKFDGWYLDEHFSKKADVLTYEKANGYVVYAKWVRTINNEYSVEHYNYRSNKKAHTLALKDCDYDFIDESHLGGIAFDGENVWVCNSYDTTVERISYDFLSLMATANSKQVIDATGVVDVFDVGNKPSCITYYGGRLWIATHNILFRSKMVAYYYDKKDDRLTSLSTYTIPARVQGVTFDASGKVYLSTSYGRNESSYIKCYKSLIALSSRPNRPDITIEMPPGSEELDSVDKRLYVIFESAGEKYLEGTDGKGNSPAPIDKILRINTDSFKN